ncbi:MAG: NAD-dependent epimerase/dehydratase family protein [Gemmatimonadetes bacterium]|nr:NAD-dependent epimerase/dehydratase family protein [Gemmatimonadota bacterium]
MRVFLTGGSGLLGSHLAAHLRGYGHEVVALHRAESNTDFLAAVGCSLVQGDVTNAPTRLTAFMRGCTHVVHAAALVYKGGSWAEVRAVNVDGTRNVLEAAAEAGIRHAVHVSSVAVYGTVSTKTDETSPVDAPVAASNLYARSKREAERAARKVESERALPVTVLRPSGVYGERDRLLTARVARMVRLPVTPLLGHGRNTIAVVYAGNVAEAMRLALEAERGAVTYDVGFDHPLTQRMLLEGIARGMGRSPRLLAVPGSLVRAGADVLGALGVSAPGVDGLPLGRVARLAMGENPYPSRRIRRDLGWSPPHRHEEALVRTGRWLREHADT